MFIWFMFFVYIVLAAYVLWRGLHCLGKVHPRLKTLWFRIPVSILFAAIWSSLPLICIIPYSGFERHLEQIGNFWLGILIYLVFCTVVIDLAVLLIKLITRKKTRPAFLSKPPVCLALVLVVLAASAVVTVCGYFHEKHIVTNSYEVTVDKDGGNIEDLNIVLISDLHLGRSIGCEQMEQMVEKVNALNPDIIVIAGDIIDNDYSCLDDPVRLADILSSMESKYGTYAVFGNHDVDALLVGGFSVTPSDEQIWDPMELEFLNNCGFKMLTDESVLIDDSFYLIGRLDGEHAGDGTDNRASVEELTANLDETKPWILLCHEPDELEENAAAGMDMELSGHTHAGQFFPLTIMNPFAWENAWGYLKVDQMHNFVSSGVGVYGPPIRVTTDSEIMQITVHFTK